jgi:hypothetical protein
VREYLDAGLMHGDTPDPGFGLLLLREGGVAKYVTNINIYKEARSKFPCVFSEDFRDVFCRLRQWRLQMRRISDKREAQDSL